MEQIKQKPKKLKGIADVVFCIDATGSMQPCIDKVKDNIFSFVNGIKSFNPNQPVDWRARILPYRDFDADEEHIKNDMKFVSTPEEIQTQLSSFQADGGGDEEESTLDALCFAALTSEWRQPCTKVVVVFSDAPSKPNLHSKTQSELGIPDIDILIQTLQEKRIKLFLYVQKDSVYEKLASYGIVKEAILFENAVEELVSADFKNLLEMLGKTISEQATSPDVL